MTSPAPGGQAPALSLSSADGIIEIPDLTGRAAVLMFYQEASTPACAAQLATLYMERSSLDELNAIVVFVSSDSTERQSVFADALGIPRCLMVSDRIGAAARAYGVFNEDTGRAHRAAFVISPDGKIALALPRYNPSNSGQLLQIFTALGFGMPDGEEVNNG